MAKNIDRFFILVGLLFAGAGFILGEIMGQSGDHTQMPTHAHIMLAGWVFAALYGVLYRLWPAMKTGVLPVFHLALHTIGSVVMIVALYLFLSNPSEASSLEMMIALGSMGVVGGWLLFLVLFLKRAKD